MNSKLLIMRTNFIKRTFMLRSKSKLINKKLHHRHPQVYIRSFCISYVLVPEFFNLSRVRWPFGAHGRLSFGQHAVKFIPPIYSPMYFPISLSLSVLKSRIKRRKRRVFLYFNDVLKAQIHKWNKVWYSNN